MDYDESIDTQRERDLEEIRKIIVQQIPYLNDGRLLFEPDEAEEIHEGTVGMLKNNKNVSVLTTYADVDAIVSNTANESTRNSVESMKANIYSQAGVSGQIFNSNGSSTLESSLDNDTALMMSLANKFSNFISYALNKVYANANITFKYTILPITYFNSDKYADSAFKLANSGYSYLLPALAMGLSQKDLSNIKDLENDVLRLGEKLRPLSSAFTQSGDAGEPGRPNMNENEKADKTIQNQDSADKNSD